MASINMWENLINPFDNGNEIKNTLSINPNAPNASELIENAPMMRLCDPIAHALLNAMSPEDMNITGDEKMRRYHLAVKCTAQSTVMLSAEEIALIKRLVGRTYGPLIVGIIYPLIDPSESSVAK